MRRPVPFPLEDVERGVGAITALRRCNSGDVESAHSCADDVLLGLVRRFVPFGEQIVEEWELVARSSSVEKVF